MENQLNELIDPEITSSNYISENSEIGTVRLKMCLLRRTHDLSWVEQADRKSVV